MAKKQRGTSPSKRTDVAALFSNAIKSFQGNRLAEALELFQQVLALDPRHADSLHYLGIIAFRIGHTDDAIKLSLQALNIAPDHASAHRTLGDAFAIKGQLAEAEKHYERVLALSPDETTYANLATIYAAGNDITRALHAIMRGLRIKETSKLKSLFAGCLQQATSVPDSEDFRAYLVRALSEPWQRPGNLAKISVSLLKRDPVIAGALDRAVAAWPGHITLSELYGPDGIDDISRNLVLRALLENTQFADIALERLLTLTRQALLDAVVASNEIIPADGDTLAFFCALAKQCFTNEYVFACSADELLKTNVLGERLRKDSPNPFAVVVFAAYQPLHTLAGCDALQRLPWPDPVQGLFTQQVHEPMAERALRDTIPQLTPISDEVSTLVRAQYEQNPYPRWVKTAPDEASGTFDRYMRSRQPGAPYRPLGKTDGIDILVAGCGTGQQVVDIASAIIDSNVTAVDLSLSSLSYAKYRTEALGLHNVSYGQADILELASLGRSFDLINCSGVLHHMRDPLLGWRTLLSLLRPNGVMEIALYSETARTEIVAAQNLIAKRGYGSTPEDIRRARQEIMSLDISAPARSVTESGDFYGTSTCRDLLFHVQEQRFTIPQIKAFLAEAGLDFIGFLLRPHLKRGYLKLFPDDRVGSNLDNWHQFEEQHPPFFRGMYQFQVQKRS